MNERKLKILLFAISLVMLGCLDTNPENDENAISQAREYVTQINNLGHAASLGHRNPSKIGGVLTGNDFEAYNEFSDQINHSSVIGDELNNVLDALIQGGLAFSSFFIEQTTEGWAMLPPPEGISSDGFNVVRGGTALDPTRTFQFNFTGPVKVCEGELVSCEVDLSIDIELDFPTSQPTAVLEHSYLSLLLKEVNLTVNTLSASNQFVSINLEPGSEVLSADRFAVRFFINEGGGQFDIIPGENLERVEMGSEGLKADLNVAIEDLQSYGAELELNLVGGIELLHLAFAMPSGDKTLELHSLEDLALHGRTRLLNELGSLITDFSKVGDTVGAGPFNYRFSDQFSGQGEDPSNYLKLDTSINRSAVIGGAELLESHVERNRTSATEVKLNNYNLRAGDVTYQLEVDLNLDGDIVYFEGEDSLSETQISVSSSDGIISGIVTSGFKQVGTVARDDEGTLVISYTDGTTQPLQWAVDEAGSEDYTP